MNTVFAFLGGLGGWEILLIMLVILIFFGAKRIPDLARGLGRGIREFKDATTEIKDNIEDGGTSHNTTSKTDSTQSSNTKDQ
ncbi:twin-arginine translocase TatA/TatE family subunit [Marivirga arenosa]|uniref:Sec-independent protein translocase protein TatA n=1 Tax=Marivirga arenosa TaxID=3059076 RepID=A0AA51N609_9BACT|nr:twin-arginine translocase TatA/TatE family subunit [Marivirga sp. ABR2-2]WMN06280.1 twin-arginine translocase TatA/TatE family subunit [Marivirga sp. ABR2-2]